MVGEAVFVEKGTVSKATLGRLPMYLELLKKLTSERFPYISATTIARHLSLGDVQVRKDLASVSGVGRPKVGYITADLIENLEHYLGYDQLTKHCWIMMSFKSSACASWLPLTATIKPSA